MIADFSGLGGRSSRVVQELRHDIMSGIFRPGDKLPGEHSLCLRFRVSRPTVRRGVSKLVREGLITVRPGAGMFVNHRDSVYAPASHTIAVMDPFNAESLSAIQSAVLRTGHLLCAYSQFDAWWNPARERAFLERLKAERAKALIAFCSPREPTNDDLLDEIAALGTRVIHIEPFRPELPRQSFIMPDYRRAGMNAAVTLMLAGYEHLYFVRMSEAPFEQLMEAGIAEACEDHGFLFDPATHRFWLPDLMQGRAEDRAAVEAFVAGLQRPAGLIFRAAHNGVAVRAFIERHGLRIPDDVGLIALHHDDDPDYGDLDRLAVCRLAIVEEAIAAVTQPVWKGVRRLVRPDRVRGSTVRRVARPRLRSASALAVNENLDPGAPGS